MFVGSSATRWRRGLKWNRYKSKIEITTMAAPPTEIPAIAAVGRLFEVVAVPVLFVEFGGRIVTMFCKSGLSHLHWEIEKLLAS